MKPVAPSVLALPRRLSLVAQTVRSLQEGIRKGIWRESLPGERELCSLLQISRPTLRAALQEIERENWIESSVRQRRRIKRRRALRDEDKSKRIVGLLTQSPLLAVPSRRVFLIEAVRDQLARAGCATEIHVNQACFSAHPARALEKLVREHPTTVWATFGCKPPMQRWFARHRLPLLVIGTCQPGPNLLSVDADHQAACRHAGSLLWRKGHRHIALVVPKDAYEGDQDSEQGLREALPGADACLQILRHDGSVTHLGALLDQAFRSPQPPTAVMVLRSLPAITVLTHLLHRGFRIPHDVALICRDDEPWLHYTLPPVARYAVSLPRFALCIARAARRLAETGIVPARAIRLMPEFLPGETI